MNPILSIRNITKLFIGGTACNNVDLDFYQGEIHTILGINGSGKTTLACILYGIYKPEGGIMFLKDERVSFNSSKDAIKSGIAVIFQSFMLVQAFTVAENLLVGSQSGNSVWVNKKKLYKEIEKISRNYGLKLNPSQKIDTASNWLKLRVEIAKALSKNAEIIIIDEPTEFLDAEEINELMMLIKFIASQGKSVILLTNKLNGILPYSDKVSVIKDGSIVHSSSSLNVTQSELINLAYGEKKDFSIRKNEFSPKKIFFEVNDLCVSGNGKIQNSLDKITFSVRNGEIFGIVGADEKQLKVLVDVINGKIDPLQGDFTVDGTKLPKCSSKELRANKISYFMEENFENGIIDEFSIVENLIYGYQNNNIFSKEGMIDKGVVNRNAVEAVQKFGIKTKNINAKAKELSIEDKRKLFCAREFYMNPQMLIVSNLEPELSFYKLSLIHEKMIELRERSYSVLLITVDMDEVMALCDRIAVIYQGKIAAILETASTSKEEIIHYLTKGGLD